MSALQSLYSIQVIESIINEIADDSLEVLGENQGLDPIQDKETVVAVLPLEIRKLFIAARECSTRAQELDAGKGRPSLTKEKANQMGREARLLNMCASICSDMAWSETLERYMKRHGINCYIRSGWTLVEAVESDSCSCGSCEALNNVVEGHANPNAVADIVDALGLDPNHGGITVVKIPISKRMRESVTEEMERREKEVLAKQKPN